MTSITLFPLFLFSTTAAAATLPSDVSALKAFKAANDPNTISLNSCLASWDFTYDPCTPSDTHFICGLTRVTQLSFYVGAGYAGTLSPLLSQLTNLTNIVLDNNKLSGPIPTSLFSLSNIVYLSLRNNSFSGTLPPVIPALKTLQILDLSHNSLSGPLPDTSSSPTLIRLDLSFNKFTGPLPKLPRFLISLAISSNNISGGISETMFNELKKVVYVDLSNNSLTGTIPSSFFLQPFLQRVYLSHNNFTAIEIFKPLNRPIDNVTFDSYIFEVDLGYNKIGGYLSANFTAHPQLSWLSLQHNKLKGPIPKEFSRRNTTITSLFLDGDYLNGKPSKDFFSKNSSVSESFGDNCLKRCPKSSKLCLKPQKPSSICRKAYVGT